jgi:hypothetical protein
MRPRVALAARIAVHTRPATGSRSPRITSIFGQFDPHIPEGSELEGATNIRLDIGGHFRILSDADCIRAVLNAVG